MLALSSGRLFPLARCVVPTMPGVDNGFKEVRFPHPSFRSWFSFLNLTVFISLHEPRAGPPFRCRSPWPLFAVLCRVRYAASLLRCFVSMIE